MKAQSRPMPREKKVLEIIVLFQNLGDDHPYYAQSPAPPLPGILLAALTPDIVDVRVLHEMVRPIDYDTDAEFIALSFMDYLAPHAYDVASRFRARGKTVVGGGKFASTFPDQVEPHFDAILVGEAQGIWPEMVRDMVNGTLKRRYESPVAGSLDNIPPPRYDLVESKYVTPVVTEATRGCPHSCTYCQLNIKRMPFRTRPIADVIRDLRSTDVLPWHKRKMAMLLDNNLGGDLSYAKALLREIAKLNFWGIGAQFSIECLRDDEFIDALAQAHCRMAFIGMESLEPQSLASVRKPQNRVEEYRMFFDKLHRRGILTFTGLMFALEEDTVEYYNQLPEMLDTVGTSVILPSIAIPLYGTPLYHSTLTEGRIIDEDLSHYEGDHIVFKHKRLSDNAIISAYSRVTLGFYSWGNIVRRLARILLKQERTEPWKEYLLRVVIVTFVYFKLSIFQRHHARVKILQLVAQSSTGTRSVETKAA